MRVRPCMLSFYFPPAYSGSAIQALNLSRHLRYLGAAPSIVTTAYPSRPRREDIGGIPIHRLPVTGRGDIRILSFWASLATFLARHRQHFDVIHAHGTLQHAVASLVGRTIGRPSLLKVAMKDSDIAFSHQGRTWGAVNRFLVSRFDRYVATTPAIAEEFASERLDCRRVRVIPNGVDTEAYAPVAPAVRERLRSTVGLPDGPLVIYVGMISARKNVDGILRIWDEATRRLGAPGHLLLLGPSPAGADGDSFAAGLRAWVAERGLGPRVSFLGERHPVAPYLQASDVFLFPSRQEGMPNCVLEAMACGLTCLVSRGVGLEEVVSPGENGWALDIADEAGFARRLAETLADGDARRRTGACARETILSRFSLDVVARRYLDLYDELLRH